MPNSLSDRPWLENLRRFRRPEAGRRSRRTRQVTFDVLEHRTLLASNWTTLTNAPPANFSMLELLTNGDVLATSDANTYLLTPDSTGSYVKGTWSQVASQPTGRLYDGSTILQNGNLFIVGGEFVNGAPTPSFSNTGDIYNVATNTWSTIANFPQPKFGDDSVELLENGEILAGYLDGPQTYLYNIATNTWTETGTKLNNDRSDEEGWVKLPDDSILSYDIFDNTGNSPGTAQRYIPSTGQWVSTGPVPAVLSNTQEFEEGPTALLPNGKAIYIGAAEVASNGNNAETAIFDPSTDSNTGGGTWTQGPSIPGGYVADDAPGVLLPNGQFIFTAGRPGSTPPTHVFDYNYTTNTITDITTSSNPPSDLKNSLNDTGSFQDRFLLLPNGQALFTAGQGLDYVFTGTGSVNSSSTPSISGITANGGNSYTLTGSALNGPSQGATYGDDAQMDTNYPIVRVATRIGTTYYATTTNWNLTGVGVTNGATSVNFALPSSISSPPNVTADSLSATAGKSLRTVTVASFTDPNGDFIARDYTATINWGDNSQSTGTISGPFGGVYKVTGSHTYTTAGSDTITVTIVDKYASGNLTVSGAGISSTAVTFNLSGTGTATASIAGTAAGVAATTGAGTATASIVSTVPGVTATTPNGTYGVGTTIPIDVVLGSLETVTGDPELTLNSGGTALHTSGSRTSKRAFT
jgi:Galactose oxidase, central domain